MRKNELGSTEFWTGKEGFKLRGIMGFETNFFQDTLGSYHSTKLNFEILGEKSSGINGNFLKILPVWNGKPENCAPFANFSCFQSSVCAGRLIAFKIMSALNSMQFRWHDFTNLRNFANAQMSSSCR